MLYEFAFESDKKVCQSDDLQNELQQYERVLRDCILALIKERKSRSDSKHAKAG